MVYVSYGSARVGIRVIRASVNFFFSRAGLDCILGISESFSFTIKSVYLHLHLVLSNFLQLLCLLSTRFVAALLAYLIVALRDVCLHEVEDRLWLKVTDGRVVDSVIAVPVDFILLIYFI